VAFYRGAVEAVEALPGVTAAGATLSLPLGGDRSTYGPFKVEGRVSDDSYDPDASGYQVVTHGYFHAMGIALVRGRFFSELDHAEAEQVAIINQRMARKYWPDQDAVGRRLTFSGETSEARWTTIVGVVADAGCSIMGEPPRPILYLPHLQKPSFSMFVVARTEGDPRAAIPAVRSAIHALDGEVPVYDFRTVDAIIHQWLRDDRLLASFFGGVAALAVGLAAVGLYGMMSYSVVQRTREIGVRIAMGANRREILGLVLRRCLRLSIIGVAVGLLLSIPAGIALASWLYGVGGTDPVTLLGVPVLLLAVALAAGYLPALRATRVDPMTALRCE
jgi:predicted permease